jgi:hypothetical protein
VVRRLVAMAAIVLVTGMTVSWVPAQAGATSEASHWSDKQRVFPRGRGVITSLSCSAPSRCTAVDLKGNASVYGKHTWHPARPADRDLGALRSVSCPTAGFCAAVGGVRAVVETAGVWRRVHVSKFHLTSVSCPSTSFCVAVGQGGRSLRYDGRWRSGPRAGSHGLLAVSCPSSTFCLAVDAVGTAYRLKQGSWHRRSAVFTGTAPQGVSLDCVSTTFCLAATDSARVARWDGRRWAQHQIYDDTRHWRGSVACSGPNFCAWGSSGGDLASWHHGWHGIAHHLALQGDFGPPALDCGGPRLCLLVGAGSPVVDRDARRFHHGWHVALAYTFRFPGGHFVSCATPTSCMAVSSSWFPVVPSRRFDGRHWVTVPSRGYEPAGDVSCPTSTFCAAMSRSWQRVLLWRGHGWSTGHHVGYGDQYSVSCASPTYCLEVSAYDDGNDSARVWDGTRWTAAPGAPGFTVSVQCPATDDCWELGNGAVAHFDGSTWGTPEKVGVFGGLTCPASDFCVAWSETGAVQVYRGSTWDAAESTVHLSALSCASSTSCTGMSAQAPNRVTRFDGATWTVHRALPRGYGVPIAKQSFFQTTPSLSCPTTEACLLVDSVGNAYRRR